VLLEHKDHKVPPEHKAFKVLLAYRAFKVSKETTELLD
jgi:hypothetical protein